MVDSAPVSVQEELSALRAETDRLRADNTRLSAENAGLREALGVQAAMIAQQQARTLELERQIGLNSSNSGKPPSSDGLKKKPRVSSLRERSGKKPGGQKGHPGTTLVQVEQPDVIVDHYPEACSDCGTALTAAMATDYGARQVFDLPEPQPLLVTEHRAHRCTCPACGQATQGQYPEEVTAPVQYGMRITAFVLYLLHGQFLTEKRLAELMFDLFGVSLSCATIGRMSRACAARLARFVGVVREQVAGAPVKHLDETGFRIGGQSRWLHVASTELLTFYRVCAQRGSLLDGLVGLVVHDHWKPYYTLEGVVHALCNAHHLRELKALVDIEKEAWARRMQIMLRRACHATNLARAANVPLNPPLVALIRRRYERILAEGLAFHDALPPIASPQAKKRGRKKRRTGHNLLLRLQLRQEDVLRFLTDPSVPFTNNLAERDGRMMKLRQKISGGFRALQAAMDFAIIRSALSTARKQGWDSLQILTQDSQKLIKALRTS